MPDITGWSEHLTKEFGVEALFDDEHWRKDEPRFVGGSALLSYSSEHILETRGRNYDVFCKTQIPRYKIVQEIGHNPPWCMKFRLWVWSERLGRYEMRKDFPWTGHDALEAAMFCEEREWRSRCSTWKEEWNRYWKPYDYQPYPLGIGYQAPGIKED